MCHVKVGITEAARAFDCINPCVYVRLDINLGQSLLPSYTHGHADAHTYTHQTITGIRTHTHTHTYSPVY